MSISGKDDSKFRAEIEIFKLYLRLRRGILFEMTFAGVIIVYHDDIKEVIIFIFNF